jgi:hypothetical protein
MLGGMRRSRAAGPSLALALLAAATILSAVDLAAQRRSENVLLVSFDGLRWQELFGGAQRELVDAEDGGVPKGDALFALRRDFVRDDPLERRRRLMPFFWGEVAVRGQVLGDPAADAEVAVTNGHNFSYPGYAELLCGFADPRIDSNAKRPNPNRTVLEFLHGREGYAGKVAAFTSWDVFPSIVDEARSGIPVNAGWELPETLATDEPSRRLYESMHATLPRYWAGVRFDALTVHAALAHVRVARPRVLYLGLGESDDWAHGRRYDLYLRAIRAADDLVAELWGELQAMPEYRDRTTLILTTDHGRGPGPRDWTDHGAKVPDCARIWAAVMGPDTPALGIRSGVRATQAQVAATVAAALGEDWPAAEPRAAPALPAVFSDGVR